jgi:hypothetical protein
MLKNTLITLALASAALATSPAQAQSAAASPAKKALVARILKVQQPVIEGSGGALAERPALDMIDQASAALESRVPLEKRDAVAKEIQGDVKKYMDDTVPFVRDRAVKLAPQTIGVLLEQKFSEDELKQLATFLESAAYNKYQQLGGEMQKSLVEKLLVDTRGTVEPKVNALNQAIGKRLGIAPAAAPLK